MGVHDPWHLWAHELLCLFLDISRAQGLISLGNPFRCSATYLSTACFISSLPILEDLRTTLFYFLRWANLVMQYFFFSSLFIRLVFINHSGKTELILKSLLHSFPPFITKGEFSSSFQIHPEIQVFLLFQLQCTVGVLDLDGERFRFLHRYNFPLDIYTPYGLPQIHEIIYTRYYLSLIIIHDC